MTTEFDDLDLEKTIRADGQVILGGRYRIVRELGRGGMGVVYLAEDTHLQNRKAAIKMLPPVLAKNKRAIEALKREALLAMELSHPHIITLRAFEQTDEGVFLVMDYVEGQTLEDMLAEHGKLDEEEMLKIFVPIAESLDFAHRRKVIHRDVKPSNIIIATDGTPYIMDFGIAREMKDTYTRVTGKGTSGTLPYMSPEQLRGASPSPAQDIYSLAATIYECLAGRPPFHRGQIEYQIINDRPETLSLCSSHLNAAIQAGLAKQPEDRPGSAKALVEKLCGESGRRNDGGKSPAREDASGGGSHTISAVGSWEHWPARKDAGGERSDGPPREKERVLKRKRSSGKNRGVVLLGAVAALGFLVAIVVLDADFGRGGSGRAGLPARVTPQAVVSPTGGTITVDCGNGVRMELVKIPAGSFQMGSNNGANEERPVHQVTISQAFYMGKYEVTQEQYEAVMGKNPSQFQGAKNPVECVSWNDAVAFCQALSSKSGRSIRLPSEAEWEYACKADKGNVDAKYYFGDDETQLANYAWYNANSGNTTHLCGQKLPNSFGLFDMSGNVFEWCNDWYGSYSSSPVTDPTGPSTGSSRVVRGGSWSRNAGHCRSSTRHCHTPVIRFINLGFRISLDLK